MKFSLLTFAALGFVFIYLKVTGVVAWSWWLVLLPFYSGFALVGGILLLFLFIAFIAAGFAE